MPSTADRGPRVGVDVGGTFTDLVAVADGELVAVKVASQPEDQTEGVIAALDASGIGPGEVAGFAHGTTMATNALLERRGARTALVTTAGFRDVIEIGRQNRPSLYNLTTPRPSPLVPRELRMTVSERVGPGGVEVPLDEESVARVIDALRAADVQAVAVCLLFSFADNSHERRLREALEAHVPHVECSLSSEVLPEFREYERFATTVADAYLRPGLTTYLTRLRERLRERVSSEPLVMQSSGGVTDLTTAAERPSTCVLSGPAAGVVAAAFVAAASGFSDLLTFDMGGTSTDVSLVLGGDVQTTTGSVVSGVPVKHPMVDVHTVSAGGGSIAWVDSGRALRVGPRSAGASPGPVCYDRGGDDVTVTDANLLLGYLEDGAKLGGELVLRRELAEQAIGRLAGDLALEPIVVADGVIRVAESEMARALRVISVERGIDPRNCTLVAFGGAGPMHACRLAEELGLTRVLVPRAAGVLSALGLAVSDLRRDYVSALLADLADLTEQGFEAALEPLERKAKRDLDSPVLQRLVDVRYRGQSFELTVAASRVEEIAPSFVEAHTRRYGYAMEGASLEVVAVRLTARSVVPKPTLAAPRQSTDGRLRPRTRSAYFDGAWAEVRVVGIDELQPGDVVGGPAIVDFLEATCVVRPGWSATVDPAGALVIEQ